MFFCKTWKKVLIAATMVVALCAPQAHASKDVVLAIASTLTTTDPWDANDTLSHACAKTFYEGLFGFNEKLELRPVLAESYDVSPDGLVYTFHLRKGVKFHDGTDFNAEAVKVNFDRVTNPENKLKRYSLYSNIAKTEVVDDLTAKVTLKTPFSPFINQLAPVLHEIAEENAGTLKVGKINVDEQMELAMRFQVSSIPMLVVFKDGKAVAKSVGYRPKSEIAAMVEGAR